MVEVLQLVATLGVAITVVRVRVAESPADLDDDAFGAVDEVDTGDVTAVAADAVLGLGSR